MTVFLVGPPGSGKSTLGQRVCREQGLRFVDLADDAATGGALDELVAAGEADVAALPWAPGRDGPWLRRCRSAGATVALWAHPLDMQARSGRTEALFTPVKGLRTRGGFGRTGTRCSEFRHLERACEHVLVTVGLSEEAAARELAALLERLRKTQELAPAQREGMAGWARHWKRGYEADAQACTILLDAMARFTMHLKARGASPRAMSATCGDLHTAGSLVMCYDSPKGKQVLACFSCGPSQYEFQRKFSASPRAWDRYRTTWEAFATFLRDSGLVEDEDG